MFCNLYQQSLELLEDLQASNNNDLIMRFLIVLAFLIVFFQISSAQNCCQNNNCGANSKCVCNTLKNTYQCLAEVTIDKSNHSIGLTTKGFYYRPSTNEYTNVQIIVCSQINTASQNITMQVFEQNKDGNVQIPGPNNYTFDLDPSCVNYFKHNSYFETYGENQYQNLLIFITTKVANSLNVTIQMQVNTRRTSSLVVPIVASIGSLIFVSFICVLIYYIYTKYFKKKPTNQSSVAQSKNSLQNPHIQVYMPAMLFSQVKFRYSMVSKTISCSVCLADMKNSNSARRSPCGHIFHQMCIDEWCLKTLMCPSCRFPLDKEHLKKQITFDHHSNQAQSQSNTQSQEVEMQIKI